MNEKKLEEMRKMIANKSHALATPIDFKILIKEGLLKQVGKSYYTDNIHALPKEVSEKIKSVSNGRYGIKLTFYKVRIFERLCSAKDFAQDVDNLNDVNILNILIISNYVVSTERNYHVNEEKAKNLKFAFNYFLFGLIFFTSCFIILNLFHILN